MSLGVPALDTQRTPTVWGRVWHSTDAMLIHWGCPSLVSSAVEERTVVLGLPQSSSWISPYNIMAVLLSWGYLDLLYLHHFPHTFPADATMLTGTETYGGQKRESGTGLHVSLGRWSRLWPGCVCEHVSGWDYHLSIDWVKQMACLHTCPLSNQLKTWIEQKGSPVFGVMLKPQLFCSLVYHLLLLNPGL